MRIGNWENELVNYLEISNSISFEWGQNDCCLWVSKFVDKIKGYNNSKDWIGLYDTEEGANALMQSRGFADTAAIADSVLPVKPLKQAKRGDIILHPCGALGICDGRRSYFLTPDKGLSVMLTLQCVKAWEL